MLSTIMNYRIFGIVSVGELGAIGGLGFLGYVIVKGVMKLLKKKA